MDGAHGLHLRACDEGEGTRAVALRFDVSESWVRRVKQERRESGKTAPCSTRRRKRIWEPFADRLVLLVKKNPDYTLVELQKALGEEISVVSLCRALQQMKITF